MWQAALLGTTMSQLCTWTNVQKCQFPFPCYVRASQEENNPSQEREMLSGTEKIQPRTWYEAKFKQQVAMKTITGRASLSKDTGCTVSMKLVLRLAGWRQVSVCLEKDAEPTLIPCRGNNYYFCRKSSPKALTDEWMKLWNVKAVSFLFKGSGSPTSYFSVFTDWSSSSKKP